MSPRCCWWCVCCCALLAATTAHPVPCRLHRNCSLNIIPDNDWRPIVPAIETQWTTTRPQRINGRRPNGVPNRATDQIVGRLPNHYTNLHTDHWDRRLDNWFYAEPVPGERLVPPHVVLMKPRRARRHHAHPTTVPGVQRYRPAFRPKLVPVGWMQPAFRPSAPNPIAESVETAGIDRPESVPQSVDPTTATGRPPVDNLSNPMHGLAPWLYTKPVRVSYRSGSSADNHHANHRAAEDDATPLVRPVDDNSMLVPIATTLKVQHDYRGGNQSAVGVGSGQHQQLANSQPQLFVVAATTASTTTTTATPPMKTPSVRTGKYGGFRAGTMQRRRRPRRRMQRKLAQSPDVYTLSRLLRLEDGGANRRRIVDDLRRAVRPPRMERRVAEVGVQAARPMPKERWLIVPR